ncbi:MAG: hypothetical protein JSS38_16250 [Nitrospira sp.]|nr:hypothetical protein [Nitrospira sp.]
MPPLKFKFPLDPNRQRSVVDTAVVKAVAVGPNENFVGIYAQSDKSMAGWFNGEVLFTGEVDIQSNLHVKGNITCDQDVQLTNADVAEEFSIDASMAIDPGTVMVSSNEETLEMCTQAYDKRVVGVVSGAGQYKPGVVLDKQNMTGRRVSIALLGKVFCKVDAAYGPINIGDLLTTSPTPGHAMKVADTAQGFGSIIGKALRACHQGNGLVPILVALQ